MPILVSDKIEFKTKTAIKDKEGQYLIKGSIQEEDANNYKCICTQHKSTKFYEVNIIELKIESNTIILVDFNTPLTSNKLTWDSIQKAAEYTFFSSAYGTFS